MKKLLDKVGNRGLTCQTWHNVCEEEIAQINPLKLYFKICLNNFCICIHAYILFFIFIILDQKDVKKEKPGRMVPLSGTSPATTKGELFIWYFVMVFAFYLWFIFYFITLVEHKKSYIKRLYYQKSPIVVIHCYVNFLNDMTLLDSTYC